MVGCNSHSQNSYTGIYTQVSSVEANGWILLLITLQA